ncbi:hypothetical protein BDV26DRAFT_259236 [Aspergillus bertholletiae]|uniref:Uncharacterized protein n=1 Tax=Aspergillus bertholletiae TaxID=1226010 RepID=A0A5N7BCV7_9EURO|nr:hypothetical protein BDV26DRAFT_259236 [Aspergillus bertholletiae]
MYLSLSSLFMIESMREKKPPILRKGWSQPTEVVSMYSTRLTVNIRLMNDGTSSSPSPLPHLVYYHKSLRQKELYIYTMILILIHASAYYVRALSHGFEFMYRLNYVRKIVRVCMCVCVCVCVESSVT